jgi:hypothetical protein
LRGHENPGMVRVVKGVSAMNWTTPTFEEIKMDAEIGSYQEDGEPMPIARDEESLDAE